MLQRRGHVAAFGRPAAGTGKKGILAYDKIIIDAGKNFPHFVGVGGVASESPLHVQPWQNLLLPGIRPGLEQFFRVVPLRRPALKAAHAAAGKVETLPRRLGITGHAVRRRFNAVTRSTSGARACHACASASGVRRPSARRRFFSSMRAFTMSAACSSVAPAATAARMQSALVAI